jgi:hypothetical protein
MVETAAARTLELLGGVAAAAVLVVVVVILVVVAAALAVSPSDSSMSDVGDGLRRRFQLDGGSAAYFSEALVATGCLLWYLRLDGGIVGRAERGGDLGGGGGGGGGGGIFVTTDNAEAAAAFHECGYGDSIVGNVDVDGSCCHDNCCGCCGNQGDILTLCVVVVVVPVVVG